MILIADSGSTKADWILVDKQANPINDFQTIGFNPFFHDEDFVEAKIKENHKLTLYADGISQVFFYGAGCSSPHLNKKIQKGLERVFKNATVLVDHDLLGAAYSCYNGEANIACIIGTGSNSCLFDGEKIHEEVPALAYILGDEGSGSYFGKILLANYLYKKLPKVIHDDFAEQFKLTKDEIFDRVYNKPNANVYLAGFTRFISTHKKHPFFQEILIDGLAHFMNTHVACYENYMELPVNFVGSVAFHFEDELKLAAKRLGINIRSVVKKPINGLVTYHFRYNLTLA